MHFNLPPSCMPEWGRFGDNESRSLAILRGLAIGAARLCLCRCECPERPQCRVKAAELQRLTGNLKVGLAIQLTCNATICLRAAQAHNTLQPQCRLHFTLQPNLYLHALSANSCFVFGQQTRPELLHGTDYSNTPTNTAHERTSIKLANREHSIYAEMGGFPMPRAAQASMTAFSWPQSAWICVSHCCSSRDSTSK